MKIIVYYPINNVMFSHQYSKKQLVVYLNYTYNTISTIISDNCI